MEDISIVHSYFPEDIFSVVWIFPYEFNKEEIFRNNIRHTYEDLKELIKEKTFLKSGNEILENLKFDSQKEYQREINKKHERRITEIEEKMNEGISPYKWVIFKNFDEYINKQPVKADYALIFEKCR